MIQSTITSANNAKKQTKFPKSAVGKAAKTTTKKISTLGTKKALIDLRVNLREALGFFEKGGVSPGMALVRLARVKKIDIIGVSDYYGASEVAEVQRARDAEASNLTVIPAVVLRCAYGVCKEVYLTAVFQDGEGDVRVKELLKRLGVPSSVEGNRDYILARPISEVIRAIEELGGGVLPTRQDKNPSRMLAIGALVEEFGFRAFDLVLQSGENYFKEKWPKEKFRFFSFSNAKCVAQLGNRLGKTTLQEASFKGLKKFLEREV